MTVSVLRPTNWRPLPTAPWHVGEPTVFRTASLKLATAEERDACPTNLTWVDLRTTPELENDQPAVLPPGWLHTHLPLVDARLEEIEASTEVMLRSLATDEMAWSDRYIEMLDDTPDRFAAAISAVLDVDGPVAVGCAGGRDRTGMTVALLLDLAGAPRDVIVRDYVATNDDLVDNLGRQPEGATDELMARLDLTCRAEHIEAVLDHLDSLGGARGYLTAALPAAEIAVLAARARDLLA